MHKLQLRVAEEKRAAAWRGVRGTTMSANEEDWESIDLEETGDVVFAEDIEEEEEAGHTDTPRGCLTVVD